MLKQKDMIAKVARVVEILLAVTFLAGAVLKARDINLFIVQISYYGVISNQTGLAAAAVGTLFVETSLGMALLLGARLRGLLYACLLALLFVFTGLILYGWFFHGLKDCGCFGPIEISPEVSIGKNVLLAAMVCGVWFALVRRGETRARSMKGLLATCAMAAVCGLAASTYAYTHLEKLGERDRPFAQFVFDADGETWDLGQGEYFVAMLSMTCEHCMDSIEGLNERFMDANLPPIVALCFEEETGAMDEFKKITEPAFPMYSVGDRIRLFFNLVGEGKEPPRFVLVRDGRAVRDWYEEVPSPEDIMEALQAPA